MKIDLQQPTIPMQGRFTKNISRKFTLAGIFFSELGYLAKDVFVPRKKVYIEINGKKIDERDLPNSVSGPSDWAGMTWNKIIFSNEDEEIMKNMTARERIEYKGKLIEQNKYTIGEIVGGKGKT